MTRLMMIRYCGDGYMNDTVQGAKCAVHMRAYKRSRVIYRVILLSSQVLLYY